MPGKPQDLFSNIVPLESLRSPSVPAIDKSEALRLKRNAEACAASAFKARHFWGAATPNTVAEVLDRIRDFLDPYTVSKAANLNPYVDDMGKAGLRLREVFTAQDNEEEEEFRVRKWLDVEDAFATLRDEIIALHRRRWVNYDPHSDYRETGLLPMALMQDDPTQIANEQTVGVPRNAA